MPQPRFDRRHQSLSERLLREGIAPRHVRRYVRELSDHFDDLVREETAGGATRTLAETRALSRLGNDDDLAEAMLSRPELRSLTSRYPWAVFGIGPIVVLASGIAAALIVEFGVIELLTAWGNAIGLKPNLATARWGTLIFTIYNTLAIYGAPLVFAWMFYWMGSRQRMPAAWIATGVAIVCILGGFQNLIFYDTGVRHGGVLLLESGLYPPFPHVAEGVARAAMNLAITGGLWWFSNRKKASAVMALSHTART